MILLMKIKKILKKHLRVIYYNTKSYLVLMTIPKLEDKIVLTSTQGSYTCNPKAICEEILEQKLPYKLVWAVFRRNIETETLKNQYPKQVKIVRKGSFAFYREVYSAKVLIDNEHNFGRRFFCKKRKNQVIIQTWHGSMGLKRIAVDNDKKAHEIIQKNLKYQSKVDYVISNSDFETNTVYRKSYWKDNTILEFGHARNDILFLKKDSNKYKMINKKIKKMYNIDLDEKIFLYAPTFREKNENGSFVELDYNKIKDMLSKKFGGKWKVVVRFHEKERNKHPDYDKEYDVIDATFYPDIQELLLISDIGVTDYSSWICDFVLTRKPTFIFAPDIDKYSSDERGFYYDLYDTPFKISKNNKEFIKSLEEFNDKEYQKKVDKFLSDRGSKEKGTASKQIVNLIKKIMKNRAK